MACDHDVRENKKVGDAHAIDTAEFEENGDVPVSVSEFHGRDRWLKNIGQNIHGSCWKTPSKAIFEKIYVPRVQSRSDSNRF
jgi:hypothetical protein